ncbi:hypothetical protein IEQ34_011430 [Dendrobium chrysotoxum]|uniref:Uncharacterized protein n=1 Tax=Dendrobium chrysotoxum TaxID=161865 RepID=A0AAV7GRM3_DENCH|nr:hypothetical protein IEQ34_011430 [Dendrobium chrysotoxum]
MITIVLVNGRTIISSSCNVRLLKLAECCKEIMKVGKCWYCKGPSGLNFEYFDQPKLLYAAVCRAKEMVQQQWGIEHHKEELRVFYGLGHGEAAVDHYGDRCKFLHLTQPQTRSNPFGFGSQSSSQFSQASQQPKPNTFGFGVQDTTQLSGVNNFVARNQNPSKVGLLAAM